MNFSTIAKNLWLPFVILALFLTAISFRPLLPIDETRYMTVAWEMFLRQGWLQPLTVNFEPYHHKPPLLFWLINLSWSVFGISRWAGLIPVVLFSMACVYLTGFLNKRLFPEIQDRQRVRLIMAGGIPFMIYGTLVMFDFMLCSFVLLSLICLYYFRQDRRLRYALLMGLCLGMGVLTKGPVAYLYVLQVELLAPFWVKEFSRAPQWYGGILAALAVSVLPVLFWLVPVLKAADSDFAFWLVWNQTAGRITGNFNASHVRPFWFYLPFIPVIFMPWLFFPSFWRGLSHAKAGLKLHEGLRFLAFWLVPVVVAFSLISGKQPHYLVPLVPGIAMLAAYCLQRLETRTLVKAFAAVLVLFIGGQMIAAHTFFKRYTLEHVAEIVKTQPTRDLAFVRNYHGELGFMARHETPVDSLQPDQLEAWFEAHPDGWAVVRFKDDQPEIKNLKMIFAHRYRGKNLGVFEK